MEHSGLTLNGSEMERVERSAFKRSAFNAIAAWVCVCALLTTLSGCGFRMRGQSMLNIESIYLTTPSNSPLGFEMRRLLRANGVKITENSQTAPVVLDVVSEKREESVLSFTPAGTAREIELRYQLQYRVRDGKGEELMPLRQLDVRRELLVTAGEVLPQESERLTLFRDMQSDAVAQIVRQLEYLRPTADRSGSVTQTDQTQQARQTPQPKQQPPSPKPAPAGAGTAKPATGKTGSGPSTAP